MKKIILRTAGLAIVIISLPWTYQIAHNISSMLFGVFYTEMRTFENEIDFLIPVYKHTWWIFIALKIVCLFTGFIIILRYVGRHCLRWIPKYKDNREIYFKALLFLILYSLAAVPLGLKEWKLRKEGNIPGVFHNSLPYYKEPFVPDQHTAADENGMNYFIRPRPWFRINSQGFPADFEYDTNLIGNKKIIMMLGDSYLEGVTDSMHDKNQYDYDSTFIERLRKKYTNYSICSFGIGGLDPTDYQLIAEKFIPELKPDLVIVVFSWNDVMAYEIPPIPCIPKHFETNWGLLPTFVDPQLNGMKRTILSTPEDAYNYCMKNFTLLTLPDLTARICRTSCILTNTYETLTDKIKIPHSMVDGSISYRHLKKICELAEKYRSKVGIAFVPDPHRIDELNSIEKNSEAYKGVFLDLLPLVYFDVGVITRKDYISEMNTHFRNSGNRKFMYLLDSIITQQLPRSD